jgi:hypothetical protein
MGNASLRPVCAAGVAAAEATAHIGPACWECLGGPNTFCGGVSQRQIEDSPGREGRGTLTFVDTVRRVGRTSNEPESVKCRRGAYRLQGTRSGTRFITLRFSRGPEGERR